VTILLLQRLPVGQVVAGQTAALALKKVKRAQVSRQPPMFAALFSKQDGRSVYNIALTL
jgi:hypothetical protein